MPRILSILLIFLACLAVAVPGARANIVSVTTTPSTAQVAVPNGSTVTVNWRVRRANTTSPADATIISTSGTIAIGGTPVATIRTTLSRPNNTPPGTDSFETITERLFVPRNVAFQMAKNTNLAATYSRTFDDGTGFTSTGLIRLVPSTESGAELGIRRLDLYFEDRSRVKVLPSGQRLIALGELHFFGTGLMEFEWQIAESSATKGALVFRRLQVFRRTLSGRGRVILRSLPLPTRAQGLHIVRLVPTDPDLAFDTPNLQYFVVPGEGATSVPPGQRIGLLRPAEGALLTAETEFSWKATPGAVVYQLALYPVRSGDPVSPGRVQSIGDGKQIDPDQLAPRPVTGIALPSEQNSISLKAYSLARLDAGRTYLWRVKSIAGNGAVIAVSPLRRITTPR